MIPHYSPKSAFTEKDSQNLEAISKDSYTSRKLNLIDINPKGSAIVEDAYHNQFEIRFFNEERRMLILRSIKNPSMFQEVISCKYQFEQKILSITGFDIGCFSNFKGEKISLYGSMDYLPPFSFENFEGEVNLVIDNIESFIPNLPLIFYHSKGAIYLIPYMITLGLETNTIEEKEGSYFIRDQEVEVKNLYDSFSLIKKIQTERVFFASGKDYYSKDGTHYSIEENSVSIIEIPFLKCNLILTEQCKVLLEDETSYPITKLNGCKDILIPTIPSTIQQISNLTYIMGEVDITSCTLTETFFGENCFLNTDGILFVTSTQKTQMENWNLIEMKTPESGDHYPIFVGSGDMKIQVKEGN